MSNEQTSRDQMSYERIIDSLNPQMRGGDNDRVGMLKRVLAKLHRPDQQFRIIHVAGTNGKGSTGTMIAQCLHQAGQKVGHFSSPAMVDQREQIQIDGCLIEKSAFAATYEKIVQQLPDDLNADDLTVFEWWTLVMLQYFADQKVDWAVIECGLGGQNDATNAIEAPKLAVITHIALDHTRILGPTIKDIAQAKAGIIKPGTGAVILAPNQDQAARAQIIKRAQACQVPVLDSEKTVQLTVLDQSWAGTRLQLKLPGAELECQFNMLGTFQLDNLKTALTAVDWLNQAELEITPERIAAVLANIVIPGRLQKIGTQPLSFLDGAHNPDAAIRLIQTLDQLGHPQKLVLVLGFLKDKNVAQMVQTYQKLNAQIILASPDQPKRAMAAKDLQQYLPNALVIADAWTAYQKAVALAGADGMVLVTGSFYLIKEIEVRI
ncbi:MAG: bifunctional folylpolyglutamate synthase/dihydrofolate synthase [Lactobacillus sp.]|nr:bifunctional folylpolyglutamate synthase/dihydrofolate synthase [Lactobacillus sp.]